MNCFEDFVKKGILFIFLMIFIIQSCSKEEIETAKIAVPSIQCKSCVKRIATALKGVEGIKHFSISLQSKMASVTYNASMLKQKEVETEIAKIGYHANETLRYESGYEKLDECCREPEEDKKENE